MYDLNNLTYNLNVIWKHFLKESKASVKQLPLINVKPIFKDGKYMQDLSKPSVVGRNTSIYKQKHQTHKKKKKKKNWINENNNNNKIKERLTEFPSKIPLKRLQSIKFST